MKNIFPCLIKMLNRPIWVGAIYLALIPIFALIYYMNQGFWETPLTAVQSIYFSVVTITTLGYGDILPQTELARILTAIEAILGIIFIGLFLNAVARSADALKEKRHNQAAKNHLLVQYKEWREDLTHACIRSCRWDSPIDFKLEKNLLNYKEFRDYFSGENRDRWYKVLGAMQDDETIIRDITHLSELFSRQVNTALGKINTENTESLGILTRVSQEQFRRVHLEIFAADPVKYIGQYVFEILAMYSTIYGSLEKDYIEEAINNL